MKTLLISRSFCRFFSGVEKKAITGKEQGEREAVFVGQNQPKLFNPNPTLVDHKHEVHHEATMLVNKDTKQAEAIVNKTLMVSKPVYLHEPIQVTEPVYQKQQVFHKPQLYEAKVQPQFVKEDAVRLPTKEYIVPQGGQVPGAYQSGAYQGGVGGVDGLGCQGVVPAAGFGYLPQGYYAEALPQGVFDGPVPEGVVAGAGFAQGVIAGPIPQGVLAGAVPQGVADEGLYAAYNKGFRYNTNPYAVPYTPLASESVPVAAKKNQIKREISMRAAKKQQLIESKRKVRNAIYPGAIDLAMEPPYFDYGGVPGNYLKDSARFTSFRPELLTFVEPLLRPEVSVVAPLAAAQPVVY